MEGRQAEEIKYNPILTLHFFTEHRSSGGYVHGTGAFSVSFFFFLATNAMCSARYGPVILFGTNITGVGGDPDNNL
jgi:hypothetical protein